MKTNITIIKRIVALAVILIVCNATSLFAQSTGGLTVEGVALKHGEGYKDAMVTVYHDPYSKNDYWPVDQFMTNNSGKFKVKLDYNSSYIVEVAALGGLIKTYFIETDILPGLLDADKEFSFKVDFAEVEILDDDINTVAKVSFDNGSDEFRYDRDDVALLLQSGNGSR